jgi:hypothetical protein
MTNYVGLFSSQKLIYYDISVLNTIYKNINLTMLNINKYTLRFNSK